MQRLTRFWSENRILVLFYLLIFVLLIFLIPDTTTPGKFDRRCWINWSNYILGNGLANIYRLDVNYLPLYHYVLWAYAKVMGSTENIIYHINNLKYVTVFFELIGIGYVVTLAKERYDSLQTVLLLSLLIIFNPAFFYDCIFYGQVDGIYSSFVFISVFYALRKNPTLSLLAFIIALNLKLQAITYAPLVFLINLPAVVAGFSLKRISFVLIPSVVLQVLILLPFILNGDLGLVKNVVTGSQGKYPLISMGAFNVWYYFIDSPKKVSDIHGFWGRSYNKYGLMMYVVAMFFSFLPLFYWSWQTLIRKVRLPEFGTGKILIMGILMSVIFFYFNTQMHSRYIHTAMIFAGAYAIYEKRYLIFGLLSVGYFLNIESSAKILKGDIVEYTYFFFNPVFVSTIFLAVLILCFYQLYSGFSHLKGKTTP